MAAEEFVLIPKHTYIREQPHASQVLFNSSIKHKKPQLSYLNRMRPLIPTKQNSVSTETLPLPLPPTPPSTPIVDPGEQSTGLLTEDETNQYQEGGEEEEKRIVDEKERKDNKINYERILLQLQIMEDKKFTRAKNILEVIKSSTRVSINAMDETIYVDNVPTGLKAASFLYDIQQQTKILHNPAYIMILSALELTEESVINKYAKHAVQSKIKEQAQRRTKSPTKSPSTSGKTKTLDSSKPSSSSKQTKRLKTRKKATTERVKEREKDEDDTKSYGTPYNDSDSSTSEKTETKVKDGKPTPTEEKLLKKSYTDKGPALFGSVKTLKATTVIPRQKVKHFLHTEPSYTKYRTVRRKIARLKVIVYDINEIWSIDLAYVDKLAKYNKDIKYLLVAVDCMSRYLRVQPLKSKYATTTAEAFNQMITTEKPKKVWVDKGTEFKGSFKTLCEKKGIKTYTTESEKKSAFAERNIRSLKSLIYKYLEDKWTYSYIDKLQDFVNTINSRTNGVIKLAPNKVTKKDVRRLISLRAEQSLKLVRRPKLYVGDFVRIAKIDIPFRKGYKQSFTDEVFEIFDIPTRNPPTYNLIDADREPIERKFYEPELIRVLEKEGSS